MIQSMETRTRFSETVNAVKANTKNFNQNRINKKILLHLSRKKKKNKAFGDQIEEAPDSYENISVDRCKVN